MAETKLYPPGSDAASLAENLCSLLVGSAGFEGDALSEERKRAFDYYFQRRRGDEVEGRAEVVSGDLSAMVEATTAQMMEAFSSDRICEFNPLDADDEDQAQLESDAVQYFVMEKGNGFLALTSAIKEALLARNAVVSVYAEDTTRHVTRRLGQVEPAALSELISADDVVRHDYNEKTGDLSVTRRVTTRELCLDSVSMENFVYASRWQQPTLEGIPFCARRFLQTRAEMIEAGMPADKVNKLTAYAYPRTTEEQGREPRSMHHKPQSPDTSQELIEYYKVFIRLGVEGGGDELRCIDLHKTDTVIIDHKAVSRINMAAGTCIMNPHRFTGISLYDKLKQNQDIRTALKRALLDNVNATNKARLAGFDGVVNVDDVTDGRVNNMVRVKQLVPSVSDALMPVMTPDTSANILANLESSARERAEMGGAALDLQTANMQIGGDRMGSQGLDRAYSVAEQLSAAMMKTISNTLIRDVFLLAHATLREWFDNPVPIKRNGKWTYVNPADWPERHSVTIKPGMSPGERARRVSSLGQVIDAQLMLTREGMEGVLVDLPGFNRALLDWCRLAEVQNPEQYFVDPESDEATAALKSKTDQANVEKMQKLALMQQAFGMEQVRLALQKYQGDADRVLEYFKTVIDSEIEEAKLVGGATVDLLKLQQHGKQKIGTTDDTGTQDSGQSTQGQPAAVGTTASSVDGAD
jgi:hypothetical protein